MLTLELVCVPVDPHEGQDQKTSMCQVYSLYSMIFWSTEMFFDLIFQIEFSFLGSLLNINLRLSYI